MRIALRYLTMPTSYSSGNVSLCKSQAAKSHVMVVSVRGLYLYDKLNNMLLEVGSDPTNTLSHFRSIALNIVTASEQTSIPYLYKMVPLAKCFIKIRSTQVSAC